MKQEPLNQLSSVLFISHGGGPLPLLGNKDHKSMIDFLKNITPGLGDPSAILVISAHWEERKPTITSGKAPALLYDYYGFQNEAYHIEYPVHGAPILAEKIFQLLQDNEIEAQLDAKRGFDHGLFVPLKIMYPDATIPCVQLSLVNNLDPQLHIQIGKALAALRKENILIIGSGFSFHNLSAIMSKGLHDPKNEAFERWLIETCSSESLSQKDREKRLVEWEKAPFARYCHPREEHLLPLHVCCGMTDSAAKLVFEGQVMGKKTSAFLWL